MSGAERELLEKKKLSSYDGIIPFEALLPRNIEHRADASTKVAAAKKLSAKFDNIHQNQLAYSRTANGKFSAELNNIYRRLA